MRYRYDYYFIDVDDYIFFRGHYSSNEWPNQFDAKQVFNRSFNEFSQDQLNNLNHSRLVFIDNEKDHTIHSFLISCDDEEDCIEAKDVLVNPLTYFSTGISVKRPEDIYTNNNLFVLSNLQVPVKHSRGLIQFRDVEDFYLTILKNLRENEIEDRALILHDSGDSFLSENLFLVIFQEYKLFPGTVVSKHIIKDPDTNQYYSLHVFELTSNLILR